MRAITLFLILMAASVSLAGCRTDNASKASSQIDGSSAAASGSALPASATTAEEHRRAEPQSDPRPLIVCFGDSLTAGFGASDGASYPDFLQRYLDRDGFHYRVINEGISGNTTKDGVDRLSDVTALKPQVVVLEFGGNDGLRGLKVETTRANLSTMIEGLKATGAKVVIAGITLPPDYGKDYVSRFTANYASLGKKYGVPVLPFLLEGVYGVPGLMQDDRTHATDKGNQVVARNVLHYVEPLLHK